MHSFFITVEARLKGIGKMENAMDQEWKQEVDGYTEESGHKDSKVNIINKNYHEMKAALCFDRSQFTVCYGTFMSSYLAQLQKYRHRK